MKKNQERLAYDIDNMTEQEKNNLFEMMDIGKTNIQNKCVDNIGVATFRPFSPTNDICEDIARVHNMVDANTKTIMLKNLDRFIKFIEAEYLKSKMRSHD